MLDLTLDECRNIQVIPINYKSAEYNARERNINLLYSLTDILKNKTAFNAIVSQDKDYINDQINLFCDKYKNIEDKSTPLQFVCNEYKQFTKRTKQYAEQWELDEDFVFCEALNNDSFLQTFSKTPGRQSIHQKTAAEWISKLPFIENFNVLTSHGSTALYISHGNIITGEEMQSQAIGKSIDFYWKYTFSDKEIDFYASHKYTKEEGGSQDNQYADIKHFLEEAQDCRMPDKYFFAIVDGEYYLHQDTSIKYRYMTRMKNLSQMCTCYQCFAVNCNTFPIYVISLIRKWLKNNFSTNEAKFEIEKLNVLFDKFKQIPDEF